MDYRSLVKAYLDYEIRTPPPGGLWWLFIIVFMGILAFKSESADGSIAEELLPPLPIRETGHANTLPNRLDEASVFSMLGVKVIILDVPEKNPTE